MTQSVRDEFWDTTRAVLMWLVVLGHTIQQCVGTGFFGHPLFKAIYLFHIPLFFFISGYFALSSIRKHKLGGLKKSFIRQLFPVFTLGSFQIILHIILGHTLSLASALNCYVCLWFLWSLFECQVFTHLLVLVRFLWARIIIICLPIVICLVCPNYVPYAEYLNLAWPCFVAGMLAKHLGFTRQHINHRWYWATPLALLCFFLFQDNWYIYTYHLTFATESAGVALFRLAAAFAAAPVFLALMHDIAARLHMAKIGTATLGIYIVQTVLFSLIAKISLPDIATHVWVILPASVLIFFLSYYLYIFTRKLPLASLMAYGDYPRAK